MALAAGSLVIPAAQLALGVLQANSPLYGAVQSAASPTTTVVVDWDTGTSVSYAISQTAGGTPLLACLVGVSSPVILGSVVDPIGVPNPGARFRGVVVAQFGVEKPDGTAQGDFCVVQCEEGFYVGPFAAFAVVPAR